MKDDTAKVVLFDLSKKESHHPNQRFKKISRHLQTTCKVRLNKDEITENILCGADLVVFGCPQEPFTLAEFDALRNFVSGGGSAAFFLAEGGERGQKTNVNYFLEEFGMSVSSDSVIRTVHYKYHHPKHVHISDCVLHPDIIHKRPRRGGDKHRTSTESEWGQSEPYAIVYPQGASIKVQHPALSVLSSGSVSFPLNRPLAGVWEGERPSHSTEKKSRGRILLVGSADVFADEWLEKEENASLFEVFRRYLLNDGVNFKRPQDPVMPDEPVDCVPDTIALAHRPKPCLQEAPPIPSDIPGLFSDGLYGIDTDLIPQAVELYGTLNVDHKMLSLVPPQFECPLIPYSPAVFPPNIRDLSSPALEKFDLDDHFASPAILLAQLTNSCKSESLDLEYYLKGCGEILNVLVDELDERAEDGDDGKRTLYQVFQKIAQFKFSDQARQLPSAFPREK